ncbi:hypothetical protein F1643_07735 [Azospirillum sp. INR13]|uniref:hypothetical protein n=1 Tax=Azospirillum sp. INR13 TaxID=2596919 RepID=UPI0018923FED|nr:hypothetical protein [Azospirillum sp. INR13]MBF5094391.1 hypothetical protein [Azospirillum sp. INR13]
MEVYTQQQFAKIVLRPQMTEEEIALSIDETAQALNNMHKLMLAQLQSRFQEIIIKSREVNPSNFADVSINWESLSQRFNGTGFNNSVVFDGAQMAKGAIAGFTIGKITSVVVGNLTKSLGITMTSRLSRALPYIGMLIPVVIEAYNAYDKEEEKKALLSDLNGVIESIRRDIHKNVVKSVYQPMIDKLISQEMVLKEAMSGS